MSIVALIIAILAGLFSPEHTYAAKSRSVEAHNAFLCSQGDAEACGR